MIPPALAAQRFGAAFLYGAVLGLAYDALRPLRPKHTTFSDLLFFAAALWAWLEVSFRVCRGDLRFGYTLGLLAGGLVWSFTAGRLVRPLFFQIYRFFSGFFLFFLKPVKKLLKKNRGFFKKHIGIRQKMGYNSMA